MNQYQYVEIVGPVLVPAAAAYNPATLEWLPDEITVARVPAPRRVLATSRFFTLTAMAALDWLPSARQPQRRLEAARIIHSLIDPITPAPPVYNPATLGWTPSRAQAFRRADNARQSVSVIDPITPTAVTATATPAGYDYGDTRKKPKRRRVIIDGLTYFVTPTEEAELLQKFIDSIERKAETLEKTAPKAKRVAKKLRAVANKSLLPDELQQRLERLKIHQALIAEESAREAAYLKATIEAIEKRNREAKAALLRQYDDEAIALILAVA